LDEFVIMPDHIHGIICIDEKREINRPSVETYNYTSTDNEKPTFPKFICASQFIIHHHPVI
jgi:REP element-mobilizing transposase RayT